MDLFISSGMSLCYFILQQESSHVNKYEAFEGCYLTFNASTFHFQLGHTKLPLNPVFTASEFSTRLTFAFIPIRLLSQSLGEFTCILRIHGSIPPCTFLVDLKVTVVMDHAAVSQPIVFLYKLFLPLVSAPCANYHIYNE